ncbi:MAG: Mut7-C RNAse domain-containing protein [Anaerolineae bacterium]|nr:Mut7-C RNAse domain-containing protein [Anaerolineae bacterium]
MSNLTTLETAPRFIADAMLGKLARWLRLLGYDTLYLQVDDATIAQRARAEGRILLTRDHDLVARRGLRVILIASQELESQLIQVVREAGNLPPDIPPRCMTCNVPLQDISPEEARESVPPYVAQTQHEFRRCPCCGRITWPATHWQGIQERLNRVRGEARE